MAQTSRPRGPVNAFAKLQEAARRIRHDTLVVYFAARDPRTPLSVRLLALAVAAYALSPIDLIPDFIPVLGYLDDLIIVPIGILLVVKLTPVEVREASRARAQAACAVPPSRAAAIAVVVLWIVAVAGVGWWVLRT